MPRRSREEESSDAGAQSQCSALHSLTFALGFKSPDVCVMNGLKSRMGEIFILLTVFFYGFSGSVKHSKGICFYIFIMEFL